jgi:hypothetical protein
VLCVVCCVLCVVCCVLCVVCCVLCVVCCVLCVVCCVLCVVCWVLGEGGPVPRSLSQPKPHVKMRGLGEAGLISQLHASDATCKITSSIKRILYVLISCELQQECSAEKTG